MKQHIAIVALITACVAEAQASLGSKFVTFSLATR
jgi:hypothetical protein